MYIVSSISSFTYFFLVVIEEKKLEEVLIVYYYYLYPSCTSYIAVVNSAWVGDSR